MKLEINPILKARSLAIHEERGADVSQPHVLDRLSFKAANGMRIVEWFGGAALVGRARLELCRADGSATITPPCG